MDNLLTNTQFTGKFFIHLDRVDSTNNYAKDYMSKTNPKDGSVILADEQYAGRGQSGNNWLAEPLKNLTFSVIYHTDFLPASEQFFLNMAVSLGLAESVGIFLNEKDNVSVKWPNDIYVHDRKIAGILIENMISGNNLSRSVIGIGLNVNQEAFPENIAATSLFLENHGAVDRMEILKKILQRVEFYFLELKAGNFTGLKETYLRHLFRFNKWHPYADKDGNFDGKITGVDRYGNLIMETQTGERSYGMKEIQFL